MKRFLLGVVSMVLATAGCGGAIDESSTTVVTLAATETPAPATTAASTEASVSITVRMIEDVSYTLEDDNLLDVHFAADRGTWPVVIVAHSGYGSKTGYRDFAAAIAAEGAVVFNINYDDVGDNPPLIGIEDIACAVRFARATAANYGGDPTRITLVGASGGAVSGMVVALNGDAYTGDCVTPEESALVDAVVAYEGGYDWAQILFSELREEDPATWEAIDPYEQIGSNPSLVVRLIHGEGGEPPFELPRIVSVEFHRALEAAGYDVELTLLDGELHLALTALGTPAFLTAVQQVIEVARG